MSGPAITWMNPDGTAFGHKKAVGPCQWWLLIPTLSTRSKVDTKIQTLSAEEQSAYMVRHVPAAGKGDYPGQACADVNEDSFAPDDNEALDGGSNIDLDA